MKICTSTANYCKGVTKTKWNLGLVTRNEKELGTARFDKARNVRRAIPVG